MPTNVQAAAITCLLGCIRSPEGYDLDVVLASMARGKAEAAEKLQSILAPLFEAGADKALMGDLLTACATVSQMGFMSEVLSTLSSEQAEAQRVSRHQRAVH